MCRRHRGIVGALLPRSCSVHLPHMRTDFASTRVTVMGLGRFGGGVGVTRWLMQQGAQVLVTDAQSEHALREPLQQLADVRDALQLRLGGHDESDFVNTDMVVANPAVPRPWANAYLNAAANASVPMTTEVRLLVERLDRMRVIGVTGSAGKSTTAAMVHHILNKAGHQAHLGGNIGGSLLNVLDTIEPDHWVVLELSSFMLHWLGEAVGSKHAEGWSPGCAVLTNIEANHLDWHETFEHYEQCKRNIFRWQQSGDLAVTGDQVRDQDIELRVPGRHNQRNAAMAVEAAMRVANVQPETARAALRDFGGLQHRLCLISEHGGMQFYDDSKSTTPAATVLAVEAFDEPSRVHLIAGGYDKGADLSEISALAEKLAGLYTIGATADTLTRLAAGSVLSCDNLETAVKRAVARMKAGDVLLLSPGCASWDQFDNYEQRGRAFQQAVHRELGL